MKNLIFTIPILLAALTTQAQDFITINVAQDARLAIVGDDIGNDPYTTDLIFRTEWQGNDKPIGYGYVFAEFEIAELNGGTYRRYLYGYGRTFYLDKLFNAPALERFKGSMSVGYGFIDYNGGDFSFDFTSQLAYKINSWLEAFAQWQIAERKALAQYGDRFKGSGAAGFKFYIFNTTHKR